MELSTCSGINTSSLKKKLNSYSLISYSEDLSKFNCCEVCPTKTGSLDGAQARAWSPPSPGNYLLGCQSLLSQIGPFPCVWDEVGSWLAEVLLFGELCSSPEGLDSIRGETPARLSPCRGWQPFSWTRGLPANNHRALSHWTKACYQGGVFPAVRTGATPCSFWSNPEPCTRAHTPPSRSVFLWPCLRLF